MMITTKTKIKLFKEKLKIKLTEINNVLNEKYILEENVGVLEGLSGIALFQFYYAKYTNNDEFADRSQLTFMTLSCKINFCFQIKKWTKLLQNKDYD